MRVRQRETQVQESKTEILSLLFHSPPRWPQWLRKAQDRSENSNMVSHVSGRGSNTWVGVRCFLVSISRELD